YLEGVEHDDRNEPDRRDEGEDHVAGDPHPLHDLLELVRRGRDEEEARRTDYGEEAEGVGEGPQDAEPEDEVDAEDEPREDEGERHGPPDPLERPGEDRDPEDGEQDRAYRDYGGSGEREREELDCDDELDPRVEPVERGDDPPEEEPSGEPVHPSSSPPLSSPW